MDTASHRDLARWFPKVGTTPHRITSPYDRRYNCIAWAIGDTGNWWERDEDGMGYWPPGVPRGYSLDAYLRAFESVGFERCDSSDLEPGFGKVAVFANATGPTHAARQLGDGKWTSKLGPSEDIEHVLEALAGDDGDECGQVVQVLKRATGQLSPAAQLGTPILEEGEGERSVVGGSESD
jgi:hypothetical protein